MSGLFAPWYARAYDLVHREKAYGDECDLLEALFRTFAGRSVRTVLDLGCGTGSHAVELARRGFTVTGVDASAAMLAAAHEKARQRGVAGLVRFVEADLRSHSGPERADAVLMMFAVLGYLVSNDELAAALASVERNLAPGGLFVFDVWYGPAVERIGPESRVRTFDPAAGVALRRTVSSVLDRPTRSCAVTIELAEARGESWRRVGRELHRVRYFDRPELERLLAEAGLELLELTAFPDLERAPDESTWNVLGVGRPRP